MSKTKPLSADEISRLEALIGYEFKEKARLDRALTHASACPPRRAITNVWSFWATAFWVSALQSFCSPSSAMRPKVSFRCV